MRKPTQTPQVEHPRIAMAILAEIEKFEKNERALCHAEKQERAKELGLPIDLGAPAKPRHR